MNHWVKFSEALTACTQCGNNEMRFLCRLEFGATTVHLCGKCLRTLEMNIYEFVKTEPVGRPEVIHALLRYARDFDGLPTTRTKLKQVVRDDIDLNTSGFTIDEAWEHIARNKWVTPSTGKLTNLGYEYLVGLDLLG